MANAQFKFQIQSNINYETVKEGLWGTRSQAICTEILCTLRGTQIGQRSNSKLGTQRRLCEELQSELMSADTHLNTAFCTGLSCTVANNTKQEMMP